MKVEQIPGEQRFLVDSESREEVKHLVDLSYQEGREKPHPACSCEQYIAKGKVCKHIIAVQQFTKQQLPKALDDSHPTQTINNVRE